jgi:glycosyltransferase involved in cell wall biosynthesis
MCKTSVIIPFMDYFEYLEEGLGSVINQTKKPEIIIADLGLKLKPMKDVRIIKSNGNYQEAVNLAVLNSNGEYICIFGCDDIMNPSYIEEAEKIFEEKHPDIVAPYGEFFGLETGIMKTTGLSDALYHGNQLYVFSLVTRKMWDKVGGYDTRIPSGLFDDWDFWIRAYRAKAVCEVLPKVMVKYRRHKRSATMNMGDGKFEQAISYLRHKGTVAYD